MTYSKIICEKWNHKWHWILPHFLSKWMGNICHLSQGFLMADIQLQAPHMHTLIKSNSWLAETTCRSLLAKSSKCFVHHPKILEASTMGSSSPGVGGMYQRCTTQTHKKFKGTLFIKPKLNMRMNASSHSCFWSLYNPATAPFIAPTWSFPSLTGIPSTLPFLTWASRSRKSVKFCPLWACLAYSHFSQKTPGQSHKARCLECMYNVVGHPLVH